MGDGMKGLILFFILAVTACGPRDMPPSASNGSGGNGASGDQAVQVLEVDGERPSSCPEKFEDSNKIVSPAETNALIYDGSVYAVLSAGARNCFRIGSDVNLSNAIDQKSDAPFAGKLKVTKVEVIPADKLSKSHAKALAMTLEELKDFAHQLMEDSKKTKGGKKGFDSKGMVNLTYFDFIVGSQPNANAETPVTLPDFQPPAPPVKDHEDFDPGL